VTDAATTDEEMAAPPSGGRRRGQGHRQRPVRWGPVRWAKVGFGVAVVAFGALFVARHAAEVGRALGEMGWLPVLGSIPLGAAGMLAAMMAWRAILADLGSPLRVGQASRVFFISQLGKYLPGSVWPMLAQVELGRALRVPRRSSFAVGLLAIVLSLAVGLSVAFTLLPVGATGALRRYWWTAFAVPVLLAALHPRVVTSGLNLLLRTVRQQPLEAAPTVRGMVRAAGWQVLNWLLLGLHCYLLVLGYHVDAARTLPLAVGGFAFAYCLGVLFIPAPAGAGVRDTVLVLALAAALARPQALAVALVSRVVMAGVDFAFGAFWASRRTRTE